MSEHFYGTKIDREADKFLVEEVLKRFQSQPATLKLKEQIWNELSKLKHQGDLKSPFTVELFEDPKGIFPDQVKVYLESKV